MTGRRKRDGDLGSRRPSSANLSASGMPGTVVGGILLYLFLVFASFLLGSFFPLQPKSRPVPTKHRTICKKPPQPFDVALAKGKTALITGAAGFVGSHMARYCSELGMSVTGMDNFAQGASNVPYLGDVRIVTGDLTNATFLQGLFSKYKFDVVYHLADASSMLASHHLPTYTYTQNLVGTANLVTEAVKARVSKFVLLSSTAVYGNTSGPWAETSATKPVEPYGISRLAAEQHVQAAGQYYGLSYAIIRVHSVYGPRLDMNHHRSTIIARVITAALSDGELVIAGEGKQKRQFTYIDDVVPHIASAAFKPQDKLLVNLGTDEITTVEEVIEHVSQMTDKAVHVKTGSSKGMVHHVQAVHDLSQCTFKMDSFTSLVDGLKMTLDWAHEAKLDFSGLRDKVAAELLVEDASLWAQHILFQQAPAGHVEAPHLIPDRRDPEARVTLPDGNGAGLDLKHTS